MPSILRRYAFREMVFPSLLAGSALTFIILIAAKAPWNSNDRLLFVLMKLAFREEISKAEVVKIFLLGLPTILMFIAPMALLVGIIIGVGRMTLDLEVRSMQTGGINLLTIFVPIILFGGILSGIAGYLSYSAEPNMVDQSIRRGAKLLISEFTNLEPGRVYDRLFKGRSGMHLYFDARDPQKGEMSGVTLMMERKVMQSKKERDKSKSAVSEKRAKLKELAQAGKITKEEYDQLEYDLELHERTDPPMMIFAKKAQFGIDQSSGEVRLDLLDGSVHLLELSDEQKSVKAPKIKVKPDGIEAAAGGGKKKTKKEEPSGNAASADAEQPAPAQSTAAATVAEGEASKSEDAQTSPALQEKEKKKGRDRDYAIIEFSKLTKVETAGLSEASGSWRTKTVPELLTIMRDEKLESNQRQKAKATLLERYSLALSSLIFAFIGLPLAIWIRPTGKSIGIVVAAGVIFVYHLMVRTGNTMVSADQAFGTIVIFAPNVLFAAIGSGLWWRAIRR